MKKVLPALAFGFLASGCVMKPVQEVASLPSTDSATDVTRYLDRISRQCWMRRQTMMQDGVVVESRLDAAGTGVITARRYASDIAPQQPFVVIDVLPNGEGSTVKVSEGDYACHLTGSCFSVGYAADVRRWLAGDETCAPKKS